ncbi:hypothetical protein FBUS_10430 [Fasciolopsis buskii]|uniref:Uncharacterized protein n=1 Tax=Fasciolopsis buskii TaxID=27845 RepID=A0A8E0VMS3_9TREM|nr:hypothetical protein FBUS_10430 [Fasciolopsis buski]
MGSTNPPPYSDNGYPVPNYPQGNQPYVAYGMAPSAPSNTIPYQPGSYYPPNQPQMYCSIPNPYMPNQQQNSIPPNPVNVQPPAQFDACARFSPNCPPVVPVSQF